MAGFRFLDRVERQSANGVDAELIEFGVGVFFLHWRAHWLGFLV
jgi:hypothetical protein